MPQAIGTDTSVGNHLDRIRRDHSGGMYVVYVCEVCGKRKREGNHTRCSKIKQKRFTERNAK